MSERIYELENRALQMLNLSNQLLEDGTFYNNLVDVIKCWRKLVAADHHGIFLANAELTFSDFRNRLQELASGTISMEPYDYHLQNVLLEETHNGIRATSLVDPNWWNSPTGQNYLHAQIKAAKRGVKIIRIFISNDSSQECREAMKIQSQYFEVRFANLPDVPIDLCTSMIISDDKLVWFSKLTEDMRFEQHRVSSKPEDVNRAIRKFNTLLDISKRYEDFKEA